MSSMSSLVALALCSVAQVCRADASAFAYLQSISDQFQQTIDAYSDAGGAGNIFAARGEFDALSLGILPPMDEISTSVQCLGITCITTAYIPAQVAQGFRADYRDGTGRQLIIECRGFSGFLVSPARRPARGKLLRVAK